MWGRGGDVPVVQAIATGSKDSISKRIYEEAASAAATAEAIQRSLSSAKIVRQFSREDELMKKTKRQHSWYPTVSVNRTAVHLRTGPATKSKEERDRIKQGKHISEMGKQLFRSASSGDLSEVGTFKQAAIKNTQQDVVVPVWRKRSVPNAQQLPALGQPLTQTAGMPKPRICNLDDYQAQKRDTISRLVARHENVNMLGLQND